jgi:hypothetical protein
MLSTYSYNTLLILFLVYFAQGFKQFGQLAITNFYKEILDLEPATT